MRVGVDLGGTKIEAVVLDGDSAVIARQRMPTPRDSYHAILDTITALIAAVEQEVGATSLPVGIGTPGTDP